MKAIRTRPSLRRMSALLTALLFFSLLAPASSLAATDLTPGHTAVIAQANGDSVRLRSAPGASSTVVGSYSEGASLTILDGPVTAGDGTLWYRVAMTSSGESGFMSSDFVWMGDATATATPPPAETPPTPVPAPGSTAAVTGTATIVGTNGDPIRCRASAGTSGVVVASFAEGDAVQLTGDAVDGWQPVRCAGRDGWVFAEFIGKRVAATGAATQTATPTVAATATPAATATESATATADDGVQSAAMTALTGQTATVSGTNGDGVRCRTRAASKAAVIAVVGEGTRLPLRDGSRDVWTAVVCAGQDGFVHHDYLTIDDAPGAGDGGGSTGSGSGVIAGTNGDGVRCRSRGSFDASVITVVGEGTQIDLRGATEGDWQPVTCAGQPGWIFADFVSVTGGSGGPGGGTAGGGSGGSTGWNAGDSAVVSGTNGTGVRLRSAADPSASIITVVGEGESVAVRAGSAGAWVAVTFKGNDGFIHGDYLTLSTGGAGGGGTGGGSGRLLTGDHALVTSTLNFRADASFSAGVLGVAADGTVVEVTGAKVDGFFPVSWAGSAGFMHGDYLVWTDQPLSVGAGGVGGGAGGDAGGGGGSADGQAMVDYARNYLGYHYVWATHGPDTFDCSGFTYWVILHVLGKDIGAGTWSQISAGEPIAYGNLQPGDLVFFQNTFTWGLSHVGIYIGDNQFIHAENEQTGIKISSLTSTYYASRWYGAVRVTR